MRTFFWIGLNSFGGPVAQIGVMHQEAVERRRWVTDEQFVHLLNFANLLPGPEALELAIHLGRLRKGVWGGIAAGLLFIWPGFASLTLLGWMSVRYGAVGAVAGFLEGIRPVAAALILLAAYRLSRRAVKGPSAVLLTAASFAASYFFEAPFIPILLGAGVLGVVLGRFRPRASSASGIGWAMVTGALLFWLSGALVQRAWAAEPSPSHSQSAQSAPGDRLPSIAWMNLKAAMVTFGGAYTALPFLKEQAVDRYHWLSDQQMLDGLALGETTPGPLICVGVYVSYLAGGLLGATVGTFFLFLPSFVLVLLLGRYAARLETWPRARQFLWGVSSGTLGLILALSAQVAPKTISSWPQALVGLAALLALWRFKATPVLVVLGAGALGMLRALM